MRSLFEEITEKVQKGELTFQRVLQEIEEIRKPIPVRLQDQKPRDPEAPDVFAIVHRKELWDNLSTTTKTIAQIIINLSLENSRKYASLKEMAISYAKKEKGIKSYKVMRAFNELKEYANKLAYY